MTGEAKPATAGFRHGVTAAVGYLVVALWAMRVVLPHPTTLLAYPAAVSDPWRALYESDSKSVTWAVTRNARVFTSGDVDRDRDGQCFPMASAYTLGESMLAEGAIGVVPFALSHDPILTTNAVVVTWLWVAAVSMYALVYHWTASPPAAFVAGLLFGFDPTRIADPGHPSVHANAWAVLALLFAHRLFATGRWRDAAGLAASLVLQLCESFYPILQLVILGGVYGLYLAARHWRRAPMLAPPLVGIAGILGTATVLLLGPYLHTAKTWGLLAGRPLTFITPNDFTPGHFAYPGTAALLLALVAIVDRARGAHRRHDHDPRLILLVAGLAVAWTILPELSLPGTGVAVPSLAYLLARVVPGFGAVRGLANLHAGVNLVVAFLAGFGTLALVQGRTPRVRRALTAAIVAAVVVEIFFPPAWLRADATSARLGTFPARPRADVLGLDRGLPPGAVLDLPFAFDLRGEMRDMAYYLMLAAYHERAVAACYNSFKGPLQREVEALARRLPDPAAADALYALGFRTLLVHRHLEAPGADPVSGLEALEGRTRLVAELPDHARFTLSSPVAVEGDLRALAGASGPDDVVDVAPPRADVPFAFRNHAATTYHHPDPIEPTDLLVRWQPEDGGLAETSETRALLPPALGRGEDTVRTIDVAVPSAPGVFEVTIAPAAAPALVLARRHARVGAGDPAGDGTPR